MSLETLTNKVICLGNGATTVFTYSFIIPTAVDAVVTFTDDEGTETVLTAAQYTITGLDDPNGGTITYPLAGSPIATGESLTLQRIVAYTQPTVLTNQGNFYPDVVEASEDYIVMQTQQLAEEVGRAIRFPAVDPAINSVAELPAWQARADKIFGFDSSGNAQMTDPAGGDPTSAANVNFLQAGAGAVSHTVQSKERMVVNVEDFMSSAQLADFVANTGSIESTDALVAAVLYVQSTFGGGIVRYGHGKAMISNYVLANRYVTIEGASAGVNYNDAGSFGTTLVAKAGSLFAIMLQYNAAGLDCQGSGLRNLSIISTGVDATAVEYGVVISSSVTVMEDVSVYGFKRNISGMNFAATKFKRVSSTWATRTGFELTFPGEKAYIHPNILAYLTAVTVTGFPSTVWTAEDLIIRRNYVGMIIRDGLNGKVSGVVEGNRHAGMILFNSMGSAGGTGSTGASIYEFNIHFENNFMVDASTPWAGTNAALYSLTALPILACKSSATEYLRGDTSLDWASTGADNTTDAGYDVWIGSVTEADPMAAAVAYYETTEMCYNNLFDRCSFATAGSIKIRSGWQIEARNCLSYYAGPAGGTGSSLTMQFGTFSYDALLWNCQSRVDDLAAVAGTRTSVIRRSGALTGEPAGIVCALGSFLGRSGTWTPAITFATPGDLAVTVNNAIGRWEIRGRRVIYQYEFNTTAFTHTTASGNLRMTGQPFAGITVTNWIQTGALTAYSGITKANYTTFSAKIASAGTYMEFFASGSAQALDNVVAANMPTGGTINLYGTIECELPPA